MKTYQFNYGKFIYIKNPSKDLIFQKIFLPQVEHKIKVKSCVFCNGHETECTIETKVLDYPEKLIVIIEQSQVNIFNIGLNLAVSNGRNISYSLIQFIDAYNNILYQINQDNTNVCHPIGINIYINEDISSKKPIVLFYDLKKCNNSINVNSQINNNQFENQQFQQNFNQQNNFQNNVNNFQNNYFNKNFQNNFDNNFQNQFNKMNNNIQGNLNMNFNNNNNMINNLGMNNNGNNMNMPNQNNFINNNNFNNNIMNNNNFNNNMMNNNMN